MWHDTPQYWNLKAFHRDIRKMTAEQRIVYLADMAEIWWPRKGTPYAVKRQRKRPSKKLCQICRASRAYCQHHIIQLQHNGPDTSWNRVHICYDCHSAVHSWMKPPENQAVSIRPYPTQYRVNQAHSYAIATLHRSFTWKRRR